MRIFVILLASLMFCVVLCVGIARPTHASIRTIQETPVQVVIQSRHQLKDAHKSTWQVILFARKNQLQLRLVGFPDRDRFRHPDPLILETTAGARFLAEDDFPKADAVSNVGQFDLLPAIRQLPKDERLILTLPLQEDDRQLIVPSAVILEWQSVIQQQERL